MSTRYNVPAPRYPQFITVFEKAVTEAQERIRAIESLELLYNTVTEALKVCNLPNDITTHLTDSEIIVNLTAVPSDSAKMIIDTTNTIGEYLVKARIHTTGIPCVYDGGSWYTMIRKWYGKNPKDKKIWRITLNIELPMEGITDLEIMSERYEHMAVSYSYRIVPRSKLKVTQNIMNKTTEEFFQKILGE
jgi:hypothetical protein